MDCGRRPRLRPPAHHYRPLCQTHVASDSYKKARWNTINVNWQTLIEAAEESVSSLHVQDMLLRHRIRRLGRVMSSSAAKYVGKFKPDKKP